MGPCGCKESDDDDDDDDDDLEEINRYRIVLRRLSNMEVMVGRMIESRIS